MIGCKYPPTEVVIDESPSEPGPEYCPGSVEPVVPGRVDNPSNDELVSKSETEVFIASTPFSMVDEWVYYVNPLDNGLWKCKPDL